jgi:hypothetical protein
VIRPFPSHASKFPSRRLTTWLPSPGLIRTRPLHPIERNWPHASHPLTTGEAVECCGVSLPVPLFGNRSFNECPLCVESRCDAVALGSNISVAAPFVRRCLSGLTMAPFSHPAHRTGQADFPHPALGQNFTPSPTARRAQACSGVRAQSARKDARVDSSRPCDAWFCA